MLAFGGAVNASRLTAALAGVIARGRAAQPAVKLTLGLAALLSD